MEYTGGEKAWESLRGRWIARVIVSVWIRLYEIFTVWFLNCLKQCCIVPTRTIQCGKTVDTRMVMIQWKKFNLDPDNVCRQSWIIAAFFFNFDRNHVKSETVLRNNGLLIDIELLFWWVVLLLACWIIYFDESYWYLAELSWIVTLHYCL